MFGLAKKRRSVSAAERAEIPVGPTLVPEPGDLPASDDAVSSDLLRRWMSLAIMQQRVIRSLAEEVASTSGFVEVEADRLSSRFRSLAVSAEQQTARVDSLTKLAKGIDVDDKLVPIEAIAVLLEQTLDDVVAKILMLSKDSMSVVYALDGLNKNVGRVDQALVELSSINGTTNMLALNARIEAERAGEAGKTFRVVADELRELSKSTSELFDNMSRELTELTNGIRSGQSTLQRVATIDMSENVLARERLEVLLKALLHRGSSLEAIVAEAVSEAELISADVDGMVTGIQFQDRTKQRLEHVVDTLNVISEAIEEIKARSTAVAPELAEIEPDTSWVVSLLNRFKLGSMRERFVAEILEGKIADSEPAEGGAPPEDSGSIELF